MTIKPPLSELIFHFAGESIFSYIDVDMYRHFTLYNKITLISSMLAIGLLLLRCFINSWIFEIAPILLISISVVGLAFTYAVSYSYLSGYIFDFNSCAFLTALFSAVILCAPALALFSRMLYFVPIWVFKRSCRCCNSRRPVGV